MCPPVHQLRLRFATQLRFPPDWQMARHAHDDCHELIVLHTGALEATVGTQPTVRVRQGQTLLYRAGQPHAERAVSGSPIRMICIHFAGTLAEPMQQRSTATASDPLGRARSLSAWLTELSPPRSPAEQQIADALLVALLGALESAQQPGTRLVQLVQSYLREHMADRITLRQLADAASMSPSHFARQFKAFSGVSPMAFVRRVRVEAVRSLLMTPQLPLRAIAALTGFADEFELSRVYKRITGSSPRGR